MLIPVLCNAASTLMSGRIAMNAEVGPSSLWLYEHRRGLCAHGNLRSDVLHCCDVFRVGSGVHRRRYVACSFSDGWITYASSVRKPLRRCPHDDVHPNRRSGPSLYIGLMSSSENAALNSGALVPPPLPRVLLLRRRYFAAALALASAIGHRFLPSCVVAGQRRLQAHPSPTIH